MEVRSEILSAFALSIWANARVLRSVDLMRRERQRLRESISFDIKKYTDLLEPRVSAAACERANQLGIELRAKRWQDQPKFDKERVIFHYEHKVPVAMIRDQCLEAESREAIETALQTAQVVWILKKEDRRLNELGYRSNRPDPDAAYRKAGIKIAE